MLQEKKKAKRCTKSHIKLSGLNNESKCVQYPGKGHAWMVFDEETHIYMITNWIKNIKDIPVKLITI